MGFRDRNSYSPCVHGGSNSQVLKLPFASDPRVSASWLMLHAPRHLARRAGPGHGRPGPVRERRTVSLTTLTQTVRPRDPFHRTGSRPDRPRRCEGQGGRGMTTGETQTVIGLRLAPAVAENGGARRTVFVAAARGRRPARRSPVSSWIGWGLCGPGPMRRPRGRARRADSPAPAAGARRAIPLSARRRSCRSCAPSPRAQATCWPGGWRALTSRVRHARRARGPGSDRIIDRNNSTAVSSS